MITKKIHCPDCNGTKNVKHKKHGLVTCLQCEGTGLVLNTDYETLQRAIIAASNNRTLVSEKVKKQSPQKNDIEKKMLGVEQIKRKKVNSLNKNIQHIALFDFKSRS